MREDLLSINDFAEELGITTQAVYKKTKTTLKPYVVLVDGKKYISKQYFSDNTTGLQNGLETTDNGCITNNGVVQPSAPCLDGKVANDATLNNGCTTNGEEEKAEGWETVANQTVPKEDAEAVGFTTKESTDGDGCKTVANQPTENMQPHGDGCTTNHGKQDAVFELMEILRAELREKDDLIRSLREDAKRMQEEIATQNSYLREQGTQLAKLLENAQKLEAGRQALEAQSLVAANPVAVETVSENTVEADPDADTSTEGKRGIFSRLFGRK